MVRQVVTANCGILFDPTAFGRNMLPELSSFIGTTPTKASAEEKAMNKSDEMQPIDDELKKKWLWWLLEIVPLHFSWQDGKGVWHTDYGCVYSAETTFYCLAP